MSQVVQLAAWAFVVWAALWLGRFFGGGSK
jgi:hypothetical protein